MKKQDFHKVQIFIKFFNFYIQSFKNFSYNESMIVVELIATALSKLSIKKFLSWMEKKNLQKKFVRGGRGRGVHE